MLYEGKKTCVYYVIGGPYVTDQTGLKGMLHWRKYTTFTLLCINSIIHLEAICP